MELLVEYTENTMAWDRNIKHTTNYMSVSFTFAHHQSPFLAFYSCEMHHVITLEHSMDVV
jgi:hypothetical protein